MLQLIINYWIEFFLGIISASLIFFIKYFYTTTKAMTEGLQSILRDRMIEIYKKCVEDGYCSISRKESFENMHKSYHRLKGNGDAIATIYTELLKMPSTDTTGKNKGRRATDKFED